MEKKYYLADDLSKELNFQNKFMLNKNQSIPRINFPFLYRKGRRIRLADFDVLYLPNNKSYNQYAVVVSTKVDKLATRRNWMRRQIKTLLSVNENCINSHYFIVIIVKKNFYRSERILEIKDKMLQTLKTLNS